jgi:hypothetical protein
MITINPPPSIDCNLVESVKANTNIQTLLTPQTEDQKQQKKKNIHHYHLKNIDEH